MAYKTPIVTNTKGEIPVIKRVPNEAYALVTQNIPIFTVDVVIKIKKGVLLGQRINDPAKGYHFTMGSRMFKGEVSFEDVAIRTARDEAGAVVEIIRPIGQYNIIFTKAYQNMTVPAHYVNLVFLAEKIGESSIFNPNASDLSKFVHITSLDQIELHPEIYEILKDSAVFEKNWRDKREFVLKNLIWE
ncbi:MAG: NUDIX domain-containing protein [Candidatus Micrarchaeota archaeon]|nr:NUDIX domain-containing protein [Candidatus Micrarchaeota archaeon]